MDLGWFGCCAVVAVCEVRIDNADACLMSWWFVVGTPKMKCKGQMLCAWSLFQRACNIVTVRMSQRRKSVESKRLRQVLRALELWVRGVHHKPQAGVFRSSSDVTPWLLNSNSSHSWDSLGSVLSKTAATDCRSKGMIEVSWLPFAFHEKSLTDTQLIFRHR